VAERTGGGLVKALTLSVDHALGSAEPWVTGSAELAATERTATWLDQLADDGLLSAEQRTRMDEVADGIRCTRPRLGRGRLPTPSTSSWRGMPDRLAQSRAALAVSVVSFQ